jgi:hypothetical protein
LGLRRFAEIIYMRRVKFAGNTEDIHVRCELGLIRAIDRFRFANPVIVSRPAAIRHLIRSALSNAGAADSAVVGAPIAGPRVAADDQVAAHV